ncbi:oligosaccharide flippase family protein [Primorskyibacter sp. S87]|uniref:oligosaccharide flippase family protein n=1 Tax=Primorskyibacter sp. S87 TaxID=3415126 RepID=UPI003C7CE469
MSVETTNPQRKSLASRVLSSSSFVTAGYGASQLIRLASNLVLARLLFPEAFGVMALVTLVIVGLELFSDIGIGPAVAQSKRGDDPDFLNTAWTIQVIRGVILWGIACLLALPLANFYDVPELQGYLFVAALGLVFSGFLPTRVETAYRHLQVGRVVLAELLSQIIGIIVMIAAAYLTRSVWALVLGGLVDAALRPILSTILIDGLPNRFRWEKSAAVELISFGKWITASTAFSFLMTQGDKLVLGKILPLVQLGIYNIGYYLASFPLILSQSVVHRVMIPVYRDAPPSASAENARFLRRVRSLLSIGTMGVLLLLSLFGPSIVALLYDERYVQSGVILTLVALAQVPQVPGVTYDRAALAASDSRGFFLLSGFRALLQFGLLLTGAIKFGLIGAIAGLALSGFLAHPAIVLLAIKHKVWDPLHDAVFLGLGTCLGAAILYHHQDAIAELIRAL